MCLCTHVHMACGLTIIHACLWWKYHLSWNTFDLWTTRRLWKGYLKLVSANVTVKEPDKVTRHIPEVTGSNIRDMDACHLSSESPTRCHIKSRFHSRYLMHSYCEGSLLDLAQFPGWVQYVLFEYHYVWPYEKNICHMIAGVGGQTCMGGITLRLPFGVQCLRD